MPSSRLGGISCRPNGDGDADADVAEGDSVDLAVSVDVSEESAIVTGEPAGGPVLVGQECCSSGTPDGGGVGLDNDDVGLTVAGDVGEGAYIPAVGVGRREI